ncbi:MULTISPECIES: chemotaxis protein CheW [unclassified Pseudomonas]|uniref:chemotaxis protein CheW n=1 Tax=unclassified Pseudomonas TaxID=196821 RepID=UPI000BD1770C|nr:MULTISPECIES: chemotaxis protein CheW [unclassified Pseudomonas]PVZ15551.1 chemosensory pili system protein ChpC [Pseudomonas sp. URIL14HWK12:I12]PVZ24925.1 chemosensory pili system protein ChpC [Pseudomonas sp. URIL14HWK12:I10]PVZ34771.1 chemosensory pili system protein ChpC [Pseudomonas sp. URIL14HWK12:I11]SNZ09249.1 chemosensory pili system protein ChpC [Pseudomonas sp. URIL14HWK12:I9]
MPERAFERRHSLTALLLPLTDRQLVLPNVAVAELIDDRPGVPVAGAPSWHLGHIAWRHRELPLLSFEAACGTEPKRGERNHIVVLNALSGGPLAFYAMLVQGIPRSFKVDSQLSYVDVPLDRFELAAVQLGESVARVPDLDGLERLVQQAWPGL